MVLFISAVIWKSPVSGIWNSHKTALLTSPIQVLTGPDPAWLPRSDEIGRLQGGAAVDRFALQKVARVPGTSHSSLTWV